MRNDAFREETIEYKRRTIKIEWFFDENCEPPWEHEDGHGPVSDWHRRDKAAGERILCEDHGSKRFYDFAAAIKLAKRDGWDAPPYKTGTKGEQAVRAVEADFKYLQRWCNNDWHWCGYHLSIDGELKDSLWGIDSDSIDDFEKDVFEQWQNWIDNEDREALDAACRDIETKN